MLFNGASKLAEDIIDTGYCTGCGICIDRCPHVQAVGEHIAVVHPCSNNDAFCYFSCPRTPTDIGELDNFVFGKHRETHQLGEYKHILWAKALKPRSLKCQYGGAVSTLMYLAMENNLINCSILTAGTPGSPKPYTAYKPEEVLGAGGSKYTAVPTLSALNKAAKKDIEKIGVVGRPCQITAVRKMQLLASKKEKAANLSASRVSISIGLFCFWAMSVEFYQWLKEKIGAAEALKLDILEEDIEINTAYQKHVFPLEEIKPFIKQSCNSCFDPTSEFADISIGVLEGIDEDWNILIVRTEAGDKLVKKALKAGMLDAGELEPHRISILSTAANNKKQRVLAENNNYLLMPTSYRNAVFQGGSINNAGNY